MEDGIRETPGRGELAALHAQLAEARAEVERLQHEAATASARAQTAIVESATLRSDLQASTDEAASAIADRESLRSQLEAASQRERTAAERYRDLVVKSEPALPAELIDGDSIDAVDASVQAARTMVGRIRSHLETRAQSSRVPAGAPPRTGPDLSALTPEQKISHGLAARG